MDDNNRFDARVVSDGACLVWTGKQNGYGYAQFRVAGRKVSVHRYSYERHNGPIPAGLVVDHICHNKVCVNPEHLRLATNKQNIENLKGAYSSSATGVRGVHPVKDSLRFQASVTHNRRRYVIGRFDTIAEAEQAVIAKRNELFTHNDVDRAASDFHKGPLPPGWNG